MRRRRENLATVGKRETLVARARTRGRKAPPGSPATRVRRGDASPGRRWRRCWQWPGGHPAHPCGPRRAFESISRSGPLARLAPPEDHRRRPPRKPKELLSCAVDRQCRRRLNLPCRQGIHRCDVREASSPRQQDGIHFHRNGRIEPPRRRTNGRAEAGHGTGPEERRREHRRAPQPAQQVPTGGERAGVGRGRRPRPHGPQGGVRRGVARDVVEGHAAADECPSARRRRPC